MKKYQVKKKGGCCGEDENGSHSHGPKKHSNKKKEVVHMELPSN
jgi:hypothetical protein